MLHVSLSARDFQLWKTSGDKGSSNAPKREGIHCHQRGLSFLFRVFLAVYEIEVAISKGTSNNSIRRPCFPVLFLSVSFSLSFSLLFFSFSCSVSFSFSLSFPLLSCPFYMNSKWRSPKLCQKRFSEIENHFQVVFEFTQKQPPWVSVYGNSGGCAVICQPLCFKRRLLLYIKKAKEPNRTEPNRFSRKPKRTVWIANRTAHHSSFKEPKRTETNRRFPATLNPKP